MTTTHSFHSQIATAPRAVRFNRLKSVARATRIKSATSGGSEEGSLGRRKHPPIKMERENQNCPNNFHFTEFNKLMCLSAERKSCSTSASFLPTIEGRATNTRSTDCWSCCWCKRKTSRKRRRALDRNTAFPTLRLVMTPTRVALPAGNILQLRMTQPRTSRCPCSRTAAKSRLVCKRLARGSRKRAGPELLIHAILDRSQSFATDPPAICENSAPTLR